MPEYSGPLPRVALCQTLWLIVAPLLLGLSFHFLSGLRRAQRGRGAETTESVLLSRDVALASVTLALAATVAHTWVLTHSGEAHASLLEHLSVGFRVGRLDAGLVFTFDGLGAVACLAACAGALSALTAVSIRPEPLGARRGRFFVWIELSLLGALLSFLAEGPFTMAVGWSLASAAAAWLCGWSDARDGVLAATRGSVALVTLLGGASLLFWGLGGTWTGESYEADARTGYVAVGQGASPSVGPQGETRVGADGERTGGLLSLTSLPGASVLVGDSRSPAYRSPFVDAPLAFGHHTLRIHEGVASNDATLAVGAREGQAVALVLFGPTLSFHELAAALAARDRHGAHFFAQLLRDRHGPAGFGLLPSVIAIWLFAAWAMGGLPVPNGAPWPLLAVSYGTTTALIGPFFAARIGFLTGLVPWIGIGIAAIGAAVIVAGTGRMFIARARARGPHPPPGLRPWVALVFALPEALAWMALGFAALPASSRLIVAAGLAGAGLVACGGWGARWLNPADDSGPMRIDAGLIFERAPAQFGALLMSYDRWVVDAVADAGTALVGVAAHVAAHSDRHLLAAPSDALARRVVRMSRAIEPALGGSLAPVAWIAIALATLLAAAFGLWRHV